MVTMITEQFLITIVALLLLLLKYITAYFAQLRGYPQAVCIHKTQKPYVMLLVEALRCKPEGRGIISRWCQWKFSLT
jgi:hypothetical protein